MTLAEYTKKNKWASFPVEYITKEFRDMKPVITICDRGLLVTVYGGPRAVIITAVMMETRCWLNADLINYLMNGMCGKRPRTWPVWEEAEAKAELRGKKDFRISGNMYREPR